MKSLITLTIVAAIIIGIAAIVLPWSKTWLGQARGDADNFWRDKVRAETLIGEARKDLEKKRDALVPDYMRLLMAKRELEGISAKKADIQASVVANDEQISNGLKILSEQSGDQVTTPKGVVYPRAHLQSFIDSLAVRNGKDQVWLEALTSQETQLHESIKFAEENFDNAKTVINDTEIEIERMAVTLAAAESFEEIQALCNALKGTGSGSDENRYLAEMRRRLDEFEATRMAKLPAQGAVLSMDLSSDNGSKAAPVSAAQKYADKYLGKSAPAPAAPAADPAPAQIDLSVPAVPSAQ